MDNSELYQELVNSFTKEKINIKQQVQLLDPIVKSLRKPSLLRWGNAGLLWIVELLAYLLMIGSLIVAFLFDRIFPYQLLVKAVNTFNANNATDVQTQNLIYWSVRGLFLLFALLFFLLGRGWHKQRIKNQVINQVGIEVKKMLGVIIERKAELETLQQKYSTQLPVDEDYEGFVVLPNQNNISPSNNGDPLL